MSCVMLVSIWVSICRNVYVSSSISLYCCVCVCCIRALLVLCVSLHLCHYLPHHTHSHTDLPTNRDKLCSCVCTCMFMCLYVSSFSCVCVYAWLYLHEFTQGNSSTSEKQAVFVHQQWMVGFWVGLHYYLQCGDFIFSTLTAVGGIERFHNRGIS